MTSLARLPLLPAAVASLALAILLPPGPAWALLVPAAGLIALAQASVPARATVWRACAATLALAALARAMPPLPLALLIDPLRDVRAALTDAILRAVPDPEGAVVAGIALGERAAIGRELADAFARSGTAHLLAVSGFNMTLVALAVALAARGRAGPVAVAALTAGALGAYALLVGPSPSVLRAAVMALVAAAGIAAGRASVGANALCFAVCVLTALDPSHAVSIGFQLSVAATAGLLALQRPFSERLTKLPSVAREGLATTLAASLPTTPLIAAAFGRVSLISPLANLVVVPLFPAVLALGLATAVVGALAPDAARPLGLAAYALAAAMRHAVALAAALPGASVEVPRGALSGVLLTALAGAVTLGVRAVAARRRSVPALPWSSGAALALPRVRLPPRAALLGALAVLLVAGGASALAPLAQRPDARVRALDVGQGDAYLVELGGATILIDGGPDPARLTALLGTVLPPWHRRLDVVVLTHAHQDHGAGLLALFGRYEIGLALEPSGLNEVPLSVLWREAAARAGVPRRPLAVGNRVRAGGVLIEVLSPNGDPRVDVPSLVLRLSAGPFSALFTGDATDPALEDLLLDPAPLRAQVYVPPHHGAETPHARTLVEAVRPRVALLSVGASNRYGHPTPATLAALEGIATYRTDRHGTVEVESDGDRLLVRAGTTGLPPRRGRPVPNAASHR